MLYKTGDCNPINVITPSEITDEEVRKLLKEAQQAALEESKQASKSKDKA